MTSEAEKLTVRVNGRDRLIEPGRTIVALLEELGEDACREDLAVALNDEIVPRVEWPSRTVWQGDVIEIVRAFQGG